MYCRHCGVEMKENTRVCTSCGFDANDGEAFCPNCGKAVQTGQSLCLNCGRLLPKKETSKKSSFERKVRAVNILTLISSCLVFILLIGVLFFPVFKTTEVFSGSNLSNKDDSYNEKNICFFGMVIEAAIKAYDARTVILPITAIILIVFALIISGNEICNKIYDIVKSKETITLARAILEKGGRLCKVNEVFICLVMGASFLFLIYGILLEISSAIVLLPLIFLAYLVVKIITEHIEKRLLAYVVSEKTQD